MTCVLGMVVRREREIREFVKTPFYRVLNTYGMYEGLTIRRRMARSSKDQNILVSLDTV